MQTIKDFLNKIKWDKSLNPFDFTIGYIDRISKKIIEVKFVDIKGIEDNFMIVGKNGEETNIPLHRIRVVKQKKDIVWKRTK